MLKVLNLILHHNFNKIKLSFFASYMKRSFHYVYDIYCTVIRYFIVSKMHIYMRHKSVVFSLHHAALQCSRHSV